MDDAMNVEGPHEGPGAEEPARGAVSGGFTDEELTALALASDPNAPIGEDAVPLSAYLSLLPSLLPQWYMPTAMARPGKGWRVPVVLTIVTAFVAIEALGLCSTFGQLVPA